MLDLGDHPNRSVGSVVAELIKSGTIETTTEVCPVRASCGPVFNPTTRPAIEWVKEPKVLASILAMTAHPRHSETHNGEDDDVQIGDGATAA